MRQLKARRLWGNSTLEVHEITAGHVRLPFHTALNSFATPRLAAEQSCPNIDTFSLGKVLGILSAADRSPQQGQFRDLLNCGRFRKVRSRFPKEERSMPILYLGPSAEKPREL